MERCVKPLNERYFKLGEKVPEKTENRNRTEVWNNSHLGGLDFLSSSFEFSWLTTYNIFKTKSQRASTVTLLIKS